jgi:hypothetical protein
MAVSAAGHGNGDFLVRLGQGGRNAANREGRNAGSANELAASQVPFHVLCV